MDLLNQVCIRRSYNWKYHTHTEQYGVATPLSKPAHSAEQAFKLAKEWGNPNLVIKAQVLAGGRGRGHFSGKNGLQGGVHMVSSFVMFYFTPSSTNSLASRTDPNRHAITQSKWLVTLSSPSKLEKKVVSATLFVSPFITSTISLTVFATGHARRTTQSYPRVLRCHSQRQISQRTRHGCIPPRRNVVSPPSLPLVE